MEAHGVDRAGLIRSCGLAYRGSRSRWTIMPPVALKAHCSWVPILVQCSLITRGAVRSVLVITSTPRTPSECSPLPLGLVAQISQDPPTQMEGDPMVRQVGKRVGVALAMLCLVATLAGAVEMTCRASDGKGNCTAGSGPDGKEIVVVGTGIAVGEKMDCTDKGTVIECTAKK